MKYAARKMAATRGVAWARRCNSTANNTASDVVTGTVPKVKIAVFRSAVQNVSLSNTLR